MTEDRTDPPAAAEDVTVDVAVVGAGIVGLATAAGLGAAGLSTAVVDRVDPAVMIDAPFDGRSSAIALSSKRLLAAVGAWPAADACPIDDIRITDDGAPVVLDYRHGDAALPDEEGRAPPFGWIVENRALRAALFERISGLPDVILRAPAALAADALDDDESDRVVLRLDDGGQVRARLLVGADGRMSGIRKARGIRTVGWSYPQHGIVATVAHDIPHANTAFEHFMAPGPFALLPMVGTAETPHRSSLVWTDRDRTAAAHAELPDAAFGAALEERFGAALGSLRPVGRRWRYPLGVFHAERYAARRTVLVGDAAHGIHPIAGQGLNLGLRDVAVLVEAAVAAFRDGRDPGADTVVREVERRRRFDNTLMIAATDGINRLFSNDVLPIRVMRDLGLAAVGRMPPAKRLFMRHAMGLVGEVPRLMRGEPL